MGQSTPTSTFRKRTEGGAATAFRSDQIQHRRNNNRKGNIHDWENKQSSGSKNSEGKQYMGASKPKGISKQSIRPKDRNTTLELINTRNDVLWAAHKGPVKKPDGEIEIYMSKTHKSDGESELEDRGVVSRKPTLRETASLDDGVAAQRNANRDNADAGATQSNDTPERLRRNADGEIAKTMGTTPPSQPRTYSQEERRVEWPTERIVWGFGKKNSLNS